MELVSGFAQVWRFHVWSWCFNVFFDKVMASVKRKVNFQAATSPKKMSRVDQVKIGGIVSVGQGGRTVTYLEEVISGHTLFFHEG